MTETAEPLRRAIAALEAQRTALGDAAVELALGPLRERLAQLEQPAQQLRQVSVLFVEVVGAAAMAPRLEPEEAARQIDALVGAIARQVQAFGGRVLQYAGDSVLAAFGTPRAHEDDAVRAVHAALAALADVARLQPAPAAAHARAGIATGQVLLGGGVDGEGTIRGLTVNLAARLEQAAAPGQLLVCAATRRVVDGRFELAPRPALAAKGIDEPVSHWAVLGALAAPMLPARRIADTPLVGRQWEWQRLQAWQSRGAAARAMLLVGDPGVGKSRLVAEFRRQGGGRWLEARAGEHERGRTYGLLRRLLAQPLGIADSATPDEDARLWLRGALPLLRHEDDAALLGHLLGLDFSQHPAVTALAGNAGALAERARRHALALLRALARRAGMLFVLLEDLHWADAASLRFVDQLLHEGRDLPLRLLATARPEIDAREPAWRGDRLDLAPLPPADATQLAQHLLAPLGEPPPLLVQTLLQQADGNPFFMQEWVAMLADRGVIETTVDGWRFHAGRLAGAGLPCTLTGVLQARLDELAPAERQALKLASVVGPEFGDDALALLAGESPPLAALLQRSFVVERGEASAGGVREFAFRHHLVQQVCYAQLLRRERVDAHRRLADWLAVQPGPPRLERIAEHLERGEEPARAYQAWTQAAQAAAERHASEGVLEHAARALALADAADARGRWSLLLLRARALEALRREGPLVETLDALDALAAAMDDDTCRALAAQRRSQLHYARGQAVQARAWAELALGLCGGRASPEAARAGQSLANALHLMGHRAEARAHATDVLEMARALALPAIEGAMHNLLGVLADEDGDALQAADAYRAALACHRACGNRGDEADVLSNLGYTELGLGDFDAANRHFAQALEIFVALGRRDRVGLVEINLALAALNAGDAAAALAQALQARRTLQDTGSRWADAAAQRLAGQARLALGHAAEAAGELAAAALAFDGLGLPYLAAEARASETWARWCAGEGPAALATARALAPALAEGSALEGAEDPLRALHDVWCVLAAAGDALAGPVLQAAQQRLQQRAARLPEGPRERWLQGASPHLRALAATVSWR